MESTIVDQIEYLLNDWIGQTNVAAILLGLEENKLAARRFLMDYGYRWNVGREKDIADIAVKKVIDIAAMLEINWVKADQEIEFYFSENIIDKDLFLKADYPQLAEKAKDICGRLYLYYSKEPNDLLEFLELIKSKLLQF